MSKVEFAIRPDQRLKYLEIFKQQKDKLEAMTGQRARDVLSASDLPTPTLASIWTLADRDEDGELTEEEFLIAYHLVCLATKGFPVPATLPPELLHSARTCVPVSLFGTVTLPILPSPTRPDFFKTYFSAVDAAPEVGQHWRYLLLMIFVTVIAVWCEWFVVRPVGLATLNLFGIGHIIMYFAVLTPRRARYVAGYIAYCGVDILVHLLLLVVTCRKAKSMTTAVICLELLLVIPFVLMDMYLAFLLRMQLGPSGLTWRSMQFWLDSAHNSAETVAVAASEREGYGAL